MIETYITSRHNPRIKFFRLLHDRKTARREGIVLVEGVRLCNEAFLSGMIPRMLVYVKDRQTLALEWSGRFAFPEDTEMLCVSEDIMEHAFMTVHPQGIAAVIEAPDFSRTLPFSENALYMVSDGISDPGNLGTIIRTADAFHFSAVILSDDTVDPFNEKAIRASMGSCFHVPIVLLDSIGEINLKIKGMGVQLIASRLDGDSIEDVQFSFPAALVVGNEARGVSDELNKMCDLTVKIPMPGAAESLNAASAFAILAYVLDQKRSESL